MKVLVYEYVSGGGLSEKPMPPSILSEGFSMLRTLVADFKAAGHSVTAVLDSRLAELNPPLAADCIVPVSSFQDAQAAIHNISKSADAAYVIAPESNHMLQSLVASIEQAGVSSLNCLAGAIEKVSDKSVLLERAKKMGLATPATAIVSAHENAAEIRRIISGKLNFPLVIKPVDGVGCSGLSVVKNANQVASAVAKVNRESLSGYFMVQELVRGAAASVSLLSTGTEVQSLSLNWQDVSLLPPESTSAYNGGQVPFSSPLKREALAMAETIVKSFQGLRGYVGVDLVLTEKEPVLIEVNPRLTVSYVGVRMIAGFNPAQGIIDAVVKHKLPRGNPSVGYAVFSKVKTPKPTTGVLQGTYRMGELVSPPFPFLGSDAAFALVLSHSATLSKAMAGLNEAKKRLRSIIRLGGN